MDVGQWTLPEKNVRGWKPTDPKRLLDFDELQKVNMLRCIRQELNTFLKTQNIKNNIKNIFPQVLIKCLPICTSSWTVLSNKWTLGYSRNVSFIQHSRYFKLGMSSSVQSFSESPNTSSSSVRTLSY